jgi:hypothetical protein
VFMRYLSNGIAIKRLEAFARQKPEGENYPNSVLSLSKNLHAFDGIEFALVARSLIFRSDQFRFDRWAGQWQTGCEAVD